MTTEAPLRLFLARHGRTLWNQHGRFQGHTDVPLDELGRSQASELAEVLRGRVAAVAASDMARASETARIVAAALEVPLLALDPDLRERGYGVFEGLTRDECRARYPEPWTRRELERDHEPPGGELRTVVIARMRRGLERIVTCMPREATSALVVGHGSSLRMFLETLSLDPVKSLANLEYREVLHDRDGFRSAAP